MDKLQFESQVSQYRIITEQNKAEIQRLYELIEARNKESEALAQEVEFSSVGVGTYPSKK